MYSHLLQTTEIALGWDFYLPLIGMVVFIFLGVRIWVVLGLGSLAMLLTTEDLPPSLLGEAHLMASIHSP